MNNEGFTLVELLMSIVILGLILAIAVPSITKLAKSIRENQRNNIITNIEVAASKYAFDTGETIIFVDELISEGYIESDDEEGNINDPVNNRRMNCYVVEMEKVSDYYNAKFIDGKNYDNNGHCDTTKLNENSADINIEVINNGTTISNLNNWISGNITLRAFSSTINIDCVTNKCEWTSSSGANEKGVDEITLDSVRGILETKYTFQMTVYGEEVKRYKASILLKIDNEAPVIYENELYVTNKFIPTSNKEVIISASDGKGSGISGYYMALNGSSCFSSSITYLENKKFTINANGKYLICVKDNAGNIASYNGLEIKYIS